MLIKLDSSNQTQPSHDFSIRFANFVLSRKKEYQIALRRASIWYSFFNLAQSFGNNTLEYSHDGGTTWTTITIDDGIYGISDLQTAIQNALRANNHYQVVAGADVFDIKIVGNLSTLKVDITLTNNFQIRFGSGTKFNELLGWNTGTYMASGSGQNPANITRSVNSLLIHCSLATGNFENGTSSDLLYSFVPAQNPGTLIDVNPQGSPIYLPINTDQNIQSIRMYLTDQLGRPIDLNGENTTYLLELIEK
jgi:hypothetical protein